MVGAGFVLTGNRAALTGGPGGSIARVTIEGLIRGSRQRVEALDRLAKSNAKAVIVHVNSPGGTVAGSEELYDSLMRVKAKKPLVVVVDGLAASGGYIAAMAADRIVAKQSAIVGSIGVIFQYPNVTELLKTIGVQVETIKSSPLKAAPSGYEPTSPEARAAVEAIVKDSYDWFKGWSATAAISTSDADAGVGRPRVHRPAGGRAQADRRARRRAGRDRLAGEGEEYRPQDAGPRLSARAAVRRPAVPACRGARDCSTPSALTALAERFKEWGAVQAVERLNLDGLLALWHPPSSN